MTPHALTTRELPPSEYFRLAETELGLVAASLPDGTKVIVVEDADGNILGTWAALLVVHAEGVWVRPDYRGTSSVARRLWLAMRRAVEGWGVDTVITSAADPLMLALLEKHGQPLPGSHFLLSLKGDR